MEKVTLGNPQNPLFRVTLSLNGISLSAEGVKMKEAENYAKA